MVRDHRSEGNGKAGQETRVSWGRVVRDMLRDFGAKIGTNGISVFLVLADHANAAGECWPSVQRIASQVNLSDRTTQRTLVMLQEHGLIEIDRRHAQSNLFRVPRLRQLPPEKSSGGETLSPSPRNAVTIPPKICHQPPENSSDELYPRELNPKELYSKEQEAGLPPGLNTDRFRAALAEWEQHRKELRKPQTASSRQRKLKELAGWGEDRAVKAIEHSIANGWQGIFEPKEDEMQRDRGDRGGRGGRGSMRYTEPSGRCTVGQPLHPGRLHTGETYEDKVHDSGKASRGECPCKNCRLVASAAG